MIVREYEEVRWFNLSSKRDSGLLRKLRVNISWGWNFLDAKDRVKIEGEEVFCYKRKAEIELKKKKKELGEDEDQILLGLLKLHN